MLLPPFGPLGGTSADWAPRRTKSRCDSCEPEVESPLAGRPPGLRNGRQAISQASLCLLAVWLLLCCPLAAPEHAESSVGPQSAAGPSARAGAGPRATQPAPTGSPRDPPHEVGGAKQRRSALQPGSILDSILGLASSETDRQAVQQEAAETSSANNGQTAAEGAPSGEQRRPSGGGGSGGGSGSGSSNAQNQFQLQLQGAGMSSSSDKVTLAGDILLGGLFPIHMKGEYHFLDCRLWLILIQI